MTRAETSRARQLPLTLTWLSCERAYDNHSHTTTACPMKTAITLRPSKSV